MNRRFLLLTSLLIVASLLIAASGVYRGMQVRGSSRELGRLTTVAVVQSIFAGVDSRTPATEVTRTPSFSPQPFTFAAMGGMVTPRIAGSPHSAPLRPAIAPGSGCTT